MRYGVYSDARKSAALLTVTLTEEAAKDEATKLALIRGGSYSIMELPGDIPERIFWGDRQSTNKLVYRISSYK